MNPNQWMAVRRWAHPGRVDGNPAVSGGHASSSFADTVKRSAWSSDEGDHRGKRTEGK